MQPHGDCESCAWNKFQPSCTECCKCKHCAHRQAFEDTLIYFSALSVCVILACLVRCGHIQFPLSDRTQAREKQEQESFWFESMCKNQSLFVSVYLGDCVNVYMWVCVCTREGLWGWEVPGRWVIGSLMQRKADSNGESWKKWGQPSCNCALSRLTRLLRGEDRTVTVSTVSTSQDCKQHIWRTLHLAFSKVHSDAVKNGEMRK